jgi:hypothetical protein
MNSTLNLTLNNDEKSIFYDNFFDERDEKSRIFEDIENDLKEKLIVSTIFHNYLKFRKK